MVHFGVGTTFTASVIYHVPLRLMRCNSEEHDKSGRAEAGPYPDCLIWPLSTPKRPLRSLLWYAQGQEMPGKEMKYRDGAHRFRHIFCRYGWSRSDALWFKLSRRLHETRKHSGSQCPCRATGPGCQCLYGVTQSSRHLINSTCAP